MTDRQIEYRSYLTTKHWKDKRLEALEHYGCICARCKEYGNDVHHLTYERMWEELIADLQILCRDCHEAVHRAQNSRGKTRKAKEGNSIHRQAIFRILSDKQKEMVCNKFSISFNILSLKLSNENDEVSLQIVQFCAELLGMKSFYDDRRKNPGEPKKKPERPKVKSLKKAKRFFSEVRRVKRKPDF